MYYCKTLDSANFQTTYNLPTTTLKHTELSESEPILFEIENKPKGNYNCFKKWINRCKKYNR